jgi:TRAP-type C4-dicarboxylate transport system permease large subunit
MGFGANLFFVFILIPGTLILFIVWALTQNKQIGRLLLFGWLGVFALAFLSITARYFTEKRQLQVYYNEGWETKFLCD